LNFHPFKFIGINKPIIFIDLFSINLLYCLFEAEAGLLDEIAAEPEGLADLEALAEPKRFPDLEAVAEPDG
jgi:hypothetical protein